MIDAKVTLSPENPRLSQVHINGNFSLSLLTLVQGITPPRILYRLISPNVREKTKVSNTKKDHVVSIKRAPRSGSTNATVASWGTVQSHNP